MKGWSPFKQEHKVVGREGRTFVINPEAIAADPVRNTKQFSDKPMYEGQQHSSHLMAWGEAEDDEGNIIYVAHPTIFQDEGGNWYSGGFKEAKRKGEVYNFSTEEEAEAFADGSWKDKHFKK